MEDKAIYSLLGLAKNGRNLVAGEFSTEKAIKERKAFLVIVANDASDNTKKKFKNSCEYYHVPFYIFGTKDMLGHSIGTEERASIALINEGFSNSIIKKLKSISEI